MSARWGVGAARLLPLLLLVVLTGSCLRPGPGDPPIRVGLVAPLSGRSGASGEAIQRGMVLAAEEANSAGGVLGRRVEVAAKDVQNDPRAGADALRELVAQQQIVAVFGGIYSPVMLGQLDAVSEMKIPLINAWGSITGITRNGRSPNYAFRVGLNDEQADEFLVRYALEVVGSRRPGLLVDTTAWGDSNLEGLRTFLLRKGVDPVGIGRFDQGDTNIVGPVERLRAAGADAIIMAADTSEGAAITRGMASIGWRVPVVSHWGVSGGRFVELAGIENAEGVLTLQTYSFLESPSPRAERVLKAYHQRFGTRSAAEIPAAIGVAQGYDGMQLLLAAIARAGTTDGAAVRDALEQLPPYDGLIKRYDPAFTPASHDPLVASDLMMTVWERGRLVPARPSRLPE
jgi:branched-chain amino acid transport system substrate-binding protein